jgi:farnesyl diphosphate synthase
MAKTTKMKTMNKLSLDDLQTTCSSRISALFAHYMQDIPAPELKTAMDYCLQSGGKRLRPMLIYATGCAFDAPWENLDIPASAVEIIHTYSLIHDDLPCMDNADLRRGKPTCHKLYGEGMAVLTGDALHTLAMQIIASHPAALKPERRLRMMTVLSKACGPYGMAAGQALDISVMSDSTISNDLLENIYHLKTGALFSACIELGHLSSHDNNEINQRALAQFGQCIGLAFQIQDDILDVEATTDQLGKPQGLDLKNNKMTYPAIHGLDRAKDKVQSLYQEALEAINYLGNQAQLLRDLTGLMLGRKK